MNKHRIYRSKVNKTRGESSTSTNLKEVLCEKISVYHDLLRNFRRHFGPTIISQITVDNLYEGLSDVKTLVKETSELDPKHGVNWIIFLSLKIILKKIQVIQTFCRIYKFRILF